MAEEDNNFDSFTIPNKGLNLLFENIQSVKKKLKKNMIKKYKSKKNN